MGERKTGRGEDYENGKIREKGWKKARVGSVAGDSRWD